MEMKKITYTALLLALYGFSSCLRDKIEDCPPLQVCIEVKDKNYSNVDKVELEEKKSEALAFREYVPTLYYILRDAATGEVVEEKGVFDVTGDGKNCPLTFCDCIPHGKYVLTVWGGLDDVTPLGDDPLAALLHAENEEGADIYLTHDTLLYDAWHNNQRVEMERTKGKLIVRMENLPDNVNYSTKTIDGVYANVNHQFKYSGTASVSKSFEWKPASEVTTKTLLAPSLKEYSSVVNLNFYDQPDKQTPILKPGDIKVTMKRNELTVLKYVYDDGQGEITCYILVNGKWELIHSMIVD